MEGNRQTTKSRHLSSLSTMIHQELLVKCCNLDFCPFHPRLYQSLNRGVFGLNM
ncbi:hypothetical protein NC652_003951 [Populus alba x Populus x berolinensis]|nr:hypothetical protein NC652_003951 [Populus alba x Populus x berolinensis]